MIQLVAVCGIGFLYYNDYLPNCIKYYRDPASYPYFMHIFGEDYQKSPKEWKIVLRDESRKKNFHECPYCAAKKREKALLPKEAVLQKQQIREVLSPPLLD
jgi:hypothetical protein